MRNITKLIVVLVAMLTIGAGAAFAHWSSSQTGTCLMNGDVISPWANWTQPQYGNPGGVPNYDTISGTWDDGLYGCGGYGGERDSITTEPLATYWWYSGTWTAGSRPTLSGGLVGDFHLMVQINLSPSYWSGEWWSTAGGCDGTMTGSSWHSDSK